MRITETPQQEKRGLVRGIAVLAGGTALERMLGYVRDVALAAVFGLGTALDAYNVALAVPFLIISLFPGRGGARVSILFIPLYTELRENGRVEEARRLAQTLMSLLALLLLAVGGLVALWPRGVARAFAPGFTGEAADVTAGVLRLLIPLLLFLGLAGFARAYLLAHERYLAPTAAHVAANLLLVLYVIVVRDRFGIKGVALATVGWGVIMLGGQLPSMLRSGMRLTSRVAWGHPGLKRFFRLLLPVTIGLGVTQINSLVDRILASTLEAGSVSALTYANRIRSLPLELFIVSVNQAVFPRLCREYARAGGAGLREVSLFNIRVSTAAALPAAVGLLALRHPIAQLAFGHGSVSPDDVRHIAGAVGCYALGLVAMAVGAPLAGMFYATQDTKTPTIISGVSLGANVVLNLILIGPLGIYGLALATSLSATLFAVITIVVLSRRLGGIGGGEISSGFLRALAAAGLMGMLAHFTFRLLGEVVTMPGTPGLAWRLGIAVVVGISSYLGAATLLRVRGTGLAWRLVKERLGRRV